MNFRLADIEDLQLIKNIYKRIIKDMEDKQISIWDEVYPCEFFEGDIRENRLYILEDEQAILAAFTLQSNCAGQECVEWQLNTKNAVYIDRFGVNVDYARQGVGGIMLKKAMKEAKCLGADVLRLFVVDINHPAISLYEKMGFIRADGVYDEFIDEDLVLHEYGYEISLENIFN